MMNSWCWKTKKKIAWWWKIIRVFLPSGRFSGQFLWRLCCFWKLILNHFRKKDNQTKGSIWFQKQTYYNIWSQRLSFLNTTIIYGSYWDFKNEPVILAAHLCDMFISFKCIYCLSSCSVGAPGKMLLEASSLSNCDAKILNPQML